MIALKRSALLVFILALVSCVTVNIYFPAAAAEKAADRIINDVWQDVASESNDQARIDGVPSATEQAVRRYPISPRQFALAVLGVISQDAQAQSVNFNATSAEIENIKAKMGARFGQVRPYFNSGAIGLTADGYVAVRDASAVAMAERGRMNQLVQAENSDRKALYKAIAAANNQPSWVGQIQQTFAGRWISQAQSGWWYQSGGSWKQK